MASSTLFSLLEAATNAFTLQESLKELVIAFSKYYVCYIDVKIEAELLINFLLVGRLLITSLCAHYTFLMDVILQIFMATKFSAS